MVGLTPAREQHAGTISPSQAVLHLTLDESLSPRPIELALGVRAIALLYSGARLEFTNK